MTGNNEVFQEAINRGHSAAWDQEWEEAAFFYRNALNESPKDLQALTSLGLALVELQRYDEALQVYSLAAEISPDDPVIYDRISLLSEHTGNEELFLSASLKAAEGYLQRQEAGKAIENLSRISRNDPENLEAHSRLALIYERSGQKQQAVVEYLAVASLFQRNHDLDRATQALNRALLISPNSREVAQALDMLSESRLLPKPTRSRAATGPLRTLPAVTRQEVAPGGSPSSGDPISQGRDKAFAELAAMIFEDRDLEPVPAQPARSGWRDLRNKASWRGGDRKADRSAIILSISQVFDLHNQDRMGEAGEALERVFAAGLESEAVIFGLGYLFTRASKLDKAEHYLKYANQYEDYAFASYLLLGSIFSQTDRVNEAALAYLAPLKLADIQVAPVDQADGLNKRYGSIIEKEAKKDDPEAKVRLCESISALLNSNEWRDRLIKARRELSVEGDNIPPIPLGEMFVEAGSSKIIDSIATINRLARAGNLRSAMEEVLFALMYAPTYLPLHIMQGEILLLEDQVLKAVEKFRVVAQAYESRGEPEQAIELLKRIIRLAPMNIEARSQLVELELSRGEADAAVRELVGVADAYYDLADLDHARENYKRAFQLAVQHSLSPNTRIQVLHQLADIEIQRLDWRKGLQIYEQIRDLDPEDENARESLVELNMRLGQENRAMEELINYLSSLLKGDRQEQALLFVERLVRENPDEKNLQSILSDLSRRKENGGEYFVDGPIMGTANDSKSEIQ